MRIFVDTSALFAVLNARDIHHEAADAQWQRLLSSEDDTAVCTNYVLLGPSPSSRAVSEWQQYGNCATSCALASSSSG